MPCWQKRQKWYTEFETKTEREMVMVGVCPESPVVSRDKLARRGVKDEAKPRTLEAMAAAG